MRNLVLSTTLCVLFSPSLVDAATAAQDLRRTWTLYHSMNPQLGEQGFTKRGVVTLEPASGDDNDGANNNPVKLTVENDADSFTAANVEAVMSSGWYQVKLVEDGRAASVVPVMTTVPACQLRRSNFRDEITLVFGQQGHVISLAYSPLVSPLAPKTCDDLENPTGEIKFNSKIQYETAVPGMYLNTILPSYQPPPGLKFIPGSSNKQKGLGGEAKPDGFGTKTEKEAEPPASIMGFFQRYWYIILPIFIMNLLSTEPEQKQQGQQGGGAPTGGEQAPAAVTRGGGGSSKRRGKRG